MTLITFPATSSPWLSALHYSPIDHTIIEFSLKISFAIATQQYSEARFLLLCLQALAPKQYDYFVEQLDISYPNSKEVTELLIERFMLEPAPFPFLTHDEVIAVILSLSADNLIKKRFLQLVPYLQNNQLFDIEPLSLYIIFKIALAAEKYIYSPAENQCWLRTGQSLCFDAQQRIFTVLPSTALPSFKTAGAVKKIINPVVCTFDDHSPHTVFYFANAVPY